MIPIKELRVGSIVNSPNGEIKINRIIQTGLTGKKDFAVAGENNHWACSIYKIEPIQIIEKHLKDLNFKLSFESDENKYFEHPKIKVFGIELLSNGKTNVLFNFGDEIRNIKLHQLQNLTTDLLL